MPPHAPPPHYQSEWSDWGNWWVFSETPSYLKLTADTRVFSWFFRKTKQWYTSTTIVPDSDFPALPHSLCSVSSSLLCFQSPATAGLSAISCPLSDCHGAQPSQIGSSHRVACVQPSPLPFHDLIVLWFSVLNNIAFSRCTTVCLPIHLQKDIAVASRFCQLWIMLPLISMCRPKF